MPSSTPDPMAVLQEGGVMGACMRSLDWTATPLGPPATWPQSLRTTVALVLRARQPMLVGWGPQLLSLYNDEVAAILGPRAANGLLRPMARLLPDVWPTVGPIYEAALAGRGQWVEDLPVRLADRDTGAQRDMRYFSFSCTPVVDEAGAVGGVLSAVVETTAKLALEHRLVEQLDNQKRLFEQAPGFICTLRGPDHVFEFVNDAHRRLFQRNVVGKPVREAFADLEGQGFFELLDEVYRTGRRYVARAVPARVRTGPDGGARELRLDFVYAPILDGQGRVAGIFCEGHEVTEAHAMQKALAEREEQLRLATEAAEVGLWDVDLVSGTLYWPQRVKAMFGLSPDVPVTLDDFHARLHPDDREAVAAAFAAAYDPDRRALYDVEYRAIGKEDGITRWIAAKGRGIFDADRRCVRVIGTAIDISARLPRLFEMFQRGDQSNGLGIGLALSLRLVQLHGGTLTGSSEGPGRGAAFTCSLPLVAAPAQAAPATRHGPLQPLRILVVDDNRDAAESLEMLLGHLGAQVQVAYDGPQALERVQREVPAVVLLDIGMPGMSGYEVARALRRQHGSELVLVALSGWGQEIDRARGRAAGFDHHLIKPADLDALRTLLDEVAQRLAGAALQADATAPGLTVG